MSTKILRVVIFATFIKCTQGESNSAGNLSDLEHYEETTTQNYNKVTNTYGKNIGSHFSIPDLNSNSDYQNKTMKKIIQVDDYYAELTTPSLENGEIICESTEWVGDEEIAWNITMDKIIYAANRHCLDEHNMYVLCVKGETALVRDRECSKIQTKISYCPEGFEENEHWCYKILKNVSYHEPCPYRLVDYLNPEGVYPEPIWIGVERLLDYGIGYFINVSLENYGDPVRIDYVRNSSMKNCVVFNGGKLVAVSCEERFARICAYRKISEYLLCQEMNCVNYEFYENHLRCICASPSAVCEKPAELAYPYQNFIVEIGAKENCKLDLQYEGDVMRWRNSGNEIAYGYWTYDMEFLTGQYSNYVLGKGGWSRSTLEGECVICEETQGGESFLKEIVLSSKENWVTVDLRGDGYLRKIKCYTDADPDILMQSFDPVGVGDVNYEFEVKLSGLYWCEAFDMVGFAVTSSEKLLMVVDYIYPIEIGLVYGDRTDPTSDFGKFPIKSFGYAQIKWIKTLGVDENLKVVKYLLHVAVQNSTTSHEYMDAYQDLSKSVKSELLKVKNSTHVSDLFNLEYCMEIREESQNAIVTWNTSKINTSIFPDVMCLTGNKLVPRKCIWDYHLGARWEETAPCKVVKKTSPNTDVLEDILNSNATTEELVYSLENVTSNSLTFAPIDIHLTAEIAEKLQPQLVDLVKFTNVMSNLFGAEKVSLTESQGDYNATDNLLGVYDKFLNHHQLENCNKTITSEHLLVYIFNSKNENSGVALINTNGGVDVEYIKRSTGLTELAAIENLEAAVYIPEELLACVTDLPISITVHSSNALFNEPNDEHEVVARNIAILLPKMCDETRHIPILFNPNNKIYKNLMRCGFWEYGDGIKGRWVEESNPEFTNSKIYSCKYPHVTHFGLFISNNGLSRYSKILDILSIVECSLSLIGLTAIIITGLLFRSWREKSNNRLILHYSAVSLLQIVTLFVADNTNIFDPIICSLTGVILHYTVLFQFYLMFVFAVQLYNKHVMVYEAHYYCMKLNLVSYYFIPSVPVILLIAIFPYGYQKSEINFCYPSGLAFVVFGLVPIAVVLFVNLVIYLAIFWQFFLKTEYKECTSEMRRKIVIIIVSFFLLGLTWIFGLLAEILQDYTLLFIFSSLASIQGFVIFVFVILNDKGVRLLYKRRYFVYLIK